MALCVSSPVSNIGITVSDEPSRCQTQTGEHQLKVIALAGRRDCFELLKSARTSVEFIKGMVWSRRFRQQRRVISVLGGLQPARV